jgi:hypothetical protein
MHTKRKSRLSKAAKTRYERIAAATPYIFQPIDPKCGIADFDSFGLRAYYRETEMTYAQIKAMFGEIEGFPTKGQRHRHLQGLLEPGCPLCLAGRYARANYRLENDGKHDLPCIPIVVQGAEGFLLQDEPEYKYQPLLYSVWKGELWERYNLELTAMYTNLFQVASNAMFVHERSEPDSQIQVDFDNVGGIVHLNLAIDLPLQRDVLNKDMLYGLDGRERDV